MWPGGTGSCWAEAGRSLGQPGASVAEASAAQAAAWDEAGWSLGQPGAAFRAAAACVAPWIAPLWPSLWWVPTLISTQVSLGVLLCHLKVAGGR